MKWLIPIAVAAVAVVYSCTPSKAYTPTQCEALSPYLGVCQPMVTNPSAKIITVTPQAEDDSPDGIAARLDWTARCKPTLSKRDPRTGMKAWLYAERGCEFGP